MANYKGTIGILTGGGDVPGLNPAIRAVTLRAVREGYKVIGLRRGWGGMIDIVRDPQADNSGACLELNERVVSKAHHSGGTFLHSSRTKPTAVSQNQMPEHLRSKYTAEKNDLTEEVLKNLEFLGIDTLIAIGGDDTLSYAHHLHKQGFKVIAIPKTMDNDVPGTDYCIGFSTCVTRTIEFTRQLRTSAGSHERILVIEVFGRYAGYTALIPTMAGAADRCVIPEYKFNIDRLAELLVADRLKNPSNYSVVLVAEGAMFDGGDMIFQDQETDAYGHKKLGGIGDLVSAQVKRLTAKYNQGRTINIINQRLGYLVRSGAPDAIDSIVPMAFGNIAFDLIEQGESGRLVALRNGRYGNVPLDLVVSKSKVVDVERFYSTDRYRPLYNNFSDLPTFIMTSEGN